LLSLEGFLGVGRVDRLQAGDPSQIGPFRLLGRLGEGGMGRVFLGESPGGRKVAIKVVHPLYASDPEFRRRFAREVASARQVGGFHTAGVVGADPGADPPWMATAYIPGPSLAEAVAAGGPLDDAGVRRLGAALAEGLAAIHECGLIHRDLKPGNVILADDGPRIIDFGIAKGADATALTGSNAVIGTLRYMSPEQLHGEELTSQSDVFALGTVLAYAATGHDAFQGPTMPAVITRILTGPPDLEPLTGDLRGVIAECLAKDPGDRPSLGDLLARFSGRGTHDPTVTAAPAPVPAPEPVPAAVPSPASRPAEAGGPAGAAQEPSFASTVDVSPFVLSPGRTDLPTAPAELRAAPAEPRAAPAEPRAAAAGKPKRRRSRRRTGVIAAGTVAVVGLATAGILALVNHPASALTATGRLTETLTTHANAADIVFSVAFGPDGIIATGNENGRTYLWSTTTGNLIATNAPPGNAGYEADSVAFGPDGLLATGDYNGRTYVWNTGTGKLTATLTNPNPRGFSLSYVEQVAFGPGGVLATADYNSSTYLWNTTTGKITATLTDPGSGENNHTNVHASSVAFGPDGSVATGDYDGSTYLWNTTTSKITATLTDPGSKGVDSVAFGPDGILAAGDGNGRTYLWITSARQITATLTDPRSKGIVSVAFGPDGILAAGDANGDTYLWNTTTGKLTATLTDPASKGVFSVAFGPDDTLATGDRNGNAYLWRITYG